MNGAESRPGGASREIMTELAEMQQSHRCAFCGYPIPSTIEAVQARGVGHCSTACAQAHLDGEDPFKNALAFKRRPIGVPVLEQALPHGIPSYATILIAGQEGTRKEGLMLEIIWRALLRGEPALLAPVDKPPTTVIDAFLAHGWNVLPYLDAGKLHIIDMYTRRLPDERIYEQRNNEWSTFLLSAFSDSIIQARDPSDLHSVSNRFDQGCEALGMSNTGVAAIDDLTELASYTPEQRAINFLKEIRGIVSKARDVPLFTGASESRREGLYPTNYPQNHEYLFDGIIDLELSDDLVDGQRIPRLSVRKMDDAWLNQRWMTYGFEPGSGFIEIPPANW